MQSVSEGGAAYSRPRRCLAAACWRRMQTSSNWIIDHVPSVGLSERRAELNDARPTLLHCLPAAAAAVYAAPGINSLFLRSRTQAASGRYRPDLNSGMQIIVPVRACVPACPCDAANAYRVTSSGSWRLTVVKGQLITPHPIPLFTPSNPNFSLSRNFLVAFFEIKSDKMQKRPFWGILQTSIDNFNTPISCTWNFQPSVTNFQLPAT